MNKVLDTAWNLWYTSDGFVFISNQGSGSKVLGADQNSCRKGGDLAVHSCQFCNESIDYEDIHYSDNVIQIEKTYWHADCYAEYFGLELEEAMEEASV